jgi:hypothetical protein
MATLQLQVEPMTPNRSARERITRRRRLQATTRRKAEIGYAAFQIHPELGPGLLEGVYEVILAKKLADMGLAVERQVPRSTFRTLF